MKITMWTIKLEVCLPCEALNKIKIQIHSTEPEEYSILYNGRLWSDKKSNPQLVCHTCQLFLSILWCI